MAFRCSICDTRLRHGFSGRLRCPLFGSCGISGGEETRTALARWQRLRGRGPYAPAPGRASRVPGGGHPQPPHRAFS